MIIDILFALGIIGILIAIYKTKFSQKKTQQQIKAQVLRETSKSTKSQPSTLKPQPTTTTTQWTGQQQPQSSQDQGQSPTTSNTRLSLHKQQKRREKQQRKQAQQHFLQQSKAKRQEYEKLQEEKQRQEQEKRRKEEEYIEMMREEERKRKEEEFNKWKDMFAVEQSGVSKQSQDQLKLKQQQLENNLLQYLMTHLSHKFSLPTKQLVEKIKKLESQNKISGVFDQRGKYLYIEQREWDAVRNYIEAKGRLKKTQMMSECARIIKIPEESDEDLVRLVNEELEKQQTK